MPLSWIALLLAGAALGWLASVILHVQSGREILGVVALGALGAVLGALLITPVLAGRLEPTGFSLPAVLLSLLGTFVALALFAATRRLQRRRPPKRVSAASGSTGTRTRSVRRPGSQR